MKLCPVQLVRQMEKDAVTSGIAEYTLMSDAGRQAADFIHKHYPEAVRFVVLCGGGNNGGDALVAAGILHQVYRRNVRVFSTRALDGFTGCAANAAAMLPEEIPFEVRETLSPGDFFPGDVIIDGLLGIGFSGGALHPAVAAFIRSANESRCPAVALDLPSGIDADSGNASPDGAVEAELTITFGALKKGLFQGDGALLRGKLRFAEIGLKQNDLPGDEYFTNVDAVRLMRRFPIDCHKNSRGKVLLWSGSEVYPGAAVLNAVGALYGGAGLVQLCSEGECRNLLPAAVVFKKLLNGSDAGSEVAAEYSRFDVLAAGSGWAQSVGRAGLEKIWDFPGTVILDADALNLASRHPEAWRRRENVIVTPHWGEACRLAAAFGITADCSRETLARRLAGILNAVVLLKGRDTLIAVPGGEITVIAAGTPLLATAGSGDVLCGVIAAQAARGYDPRDAVVLGAYIHGIAGEIASGVLIADELPENVGKVIHKLQYNEIF